MAEYTPLPIPLVPIVPEDVERHDVGLTDEQEAKRKHVLEHFDKADYRIPGFDEKAEMMDEEKMWLVSRTLCARIPSCANWSY